MPSHKGIKMEKSYKVEIKDRSRQILFRNRVIRTPVTFTVTEKELILLEAEIRHKGIEKYSVMDYSKTEVTIPDSKEEEFKIEEEKEVIIEELCEEKPKSILEKLIKDGK